jgi:hypothetical protein
MPDLSVTVDHNDIVVSKPSVGLSIISQARPHPRSHRAYADRPQRRGADLPRWSLESCLRQGAVAWLALLIKGAKEEEEAHQRCGPPSGSLGGNSDWGEQSQLRPISQLEE